MRNKAEKARQDSSSDTQYQSETEEQSVRVLKLRQQRIVSNPASPALSLPPKLDPPYHQQQQGSAVSAGGPPKPPRYSFPEYDRRLGGDGGAASDGELNVHRSRTSQQLPQQFVKQDKDKIKQQQGDQEPSRKQMRRRDSHSRRHTLQNGIDYGLVIILYLGKTRACLLSK